MKNKILQILLSGATLLASGCSRDEEPAERPAAQIETLQADWSEVGPATDATFLESSAEVIASAESRAVVATVAATRIERIHVEPGQAVTKGEPLLDVVMPEMAEVAGRYAGSQSLRQTLETQRKDLASLVDRGLVSRREERALRLRIAELDAELVIAASKLRAAGLEPAGARKLANQGGATVLTAPIDGVVVDVHAIGGNHYEPGHLLAELVGTQSRRIEAMIPPDLGAEVPAVFAKLDGTELPVVAKGLSHTVDARSGMTRAWYELRDQSLPAGTPGTLRFRIQDSKTLVSVPSSCIARDSGKTRVWKRTGNDEASPVDIEIIASGRGKSVVSGGLVIGDRIAADPLRFEHEAP